MKKTICLIMVFIFILCLCSCESICRESEYCIDIWTDTETGVQYIICSGNGYQSMGGITPRLNADGTLYHPTEKGGVQG